MKIFKTESTDSNNSVDNDKCWIFLPSNYAAWFLVVGVIVGAASGVGLAEGVDKWLGIITFFVCAILGYVIGAALDNDKFPCCHTGKNKTCIA